MATTAKAKARSEEPGYKTSEFWLTLTIVICATVLRGMQLISDEMWGGVAGVGGLGYNINRAIVKR